MEKEHSTHESKEENQRQEGVEYKPTLGVPFTVEEIEKQKGEYDKDGFYILEDGSFYDPKGYYFDAEGYDAYAGYYDEYGYYVPGDNYAEDYYLNYG